MCIRFIGLGVLLMVSPAFASDGNPPALSERAPTPVVRVDISRGLGALSAPLGLVAFGDYQCAYCRNFDATTLPALVRLYIEPGVLRFFHKDFPLPRHSHAVAAALAAHCAGDQGQYWQMHRQLYQRQERLGDALFTELASELGLDLPTFDACRASRTPRQAMQRDVADGRALGVSATPTFILGRIENNHVVVERIAHGAAALEVFTREIEALRAASVAKPPDAGAPALPQ
jgi:protein-disulfide isomerase